MEMEMGMEKKMTLTNETMELNTAWIEAGHRVTDLKTKRNIDFLDDEVSVEKVGILSAQIEAAEAKRDIAELKYLKALQTENNGDEKVNQQQKAVKNAYTNFVLKKYMGPDQKALLTFNDDNGQVVWKEELFGEVEELKHPYKSMKLFTDVIPVKTFKGMYVLEDETTIDTLTELDDLDTVIREGDPKLDSVKYGIRRFGCIVPVPLSTVEDSEYNILTVLEKSHLKKKFKTENIEIFTKLVDPSNKTAITLTSYSDLDDSLTEDLSPSIEDETIIATNQDGYKKLKSLLKADGVLKDYIQYKMVPGFTQPVRFFNGYRLEVFSNAELPTTGGKAPFLYGSFKEVVKYFDKDETLVLSSTQYKFGTDTVSTRFIDQYDIQVVNLQDYQYGLMTL
jgi:HK97 family phage major capsid protein